MMMKLPQNEGYGWVFLNDNNNMIMMAIAKVKAADESEYRVEIENCHGSDEANFMLFVSGYFYVYLSTVWTTFYGPDCTYYFYFSFPSSGRSKTFR